MKLKVIYPGQCTAAMHRAYRIRQRLERIKERGAVSACCPACGAQYETYKGTTRRDGRCDDCDLLAAELAKRCHAAVARAIRHGDLAPARTLKCTDCPKQAIRYDHRDYHQPLLVEPVCGRCNVLRGPAAPFNKLIAA